MGPGRIRPVCAHLQQPFVGGMQGLFADAIRRGDAYDRLDEGSTLEDLKKWLVDKWEVPIGEADSATP